MAQPAADGRERGGLKLAIIIGSLGRGGSERQIVEFVRATHPTHAECLVFCLTEAGPLATDVAETGARVIELRFRRSPTAARSLARLLRLLRAERPDAVCAFLFWSYVIAVPAAALVTPRSVRISGRASMPEFDVPRQKWLVWLRGPSDRLTDAVITNSEAVRHAWHDAVPSVRHKLHVVPYGVRVRRSPAAREAKKVATIACVANLIAYKGHTTLIRAVAQLQDLEWRLLLAGEGPERESIAALSRRLGIEQRVALLGVVDDIDAVFRRADLAVLASDTEGLPNAVLEAMAHGLPVVATAVGGIPQLLQTGAGRCVPPRDPAALAQAIRVYLEDPALRRRAGDIGRHEVEENYSIEAMRDRMLDVLRAACAAAPEARTDVTTKAKLP